MDVVGRQEAPVFTWNPVEQMWVQERGGAAKPPPAPHDVHAIQSWFLDADGNEWIQTVLGPMGRQLAAQWRGAYRVPDNAVVRQTRPKGKRGGLPLMLVGGVALAAIVGGVAVAAPALMAPSSPAPIATLPTATAAAAATTLPTPAATVPAAETAPPTPQPTEAARTVAPVVPRATPRPVTITKPAGPFVTFGNGTTVVYTGPLSIARNAYLPGTFTVIRANGRPGTGVFIIQLGSLQQPLRTVSGSLDPARGTIAMDVPATLPPGNWPLYFTYEGAIVQIATIRVL